MIIANTLWPSCSSLSKISSSLHALHCHTWKVSLMTSCSKNPLACSYFMMEYAVRSCSWICNTSSTTIHSHKERVANSATNAMYSSIACSFVFPFCSFHAFHLAFPTQSKNPGWAVLQSPIVPCLKRLYNLSNSWSVGFFVNDLADSAAAWNRD